jgi:tRNA(fMet)-specific endonuclease VapC
MTYLLDTNACIALINGKPPGVRHRFQKVVEKGARVNVSAIVIFELRYGVAKSIQKEANADRLEIFLSGPISILPFDEEDAEAAGRLRAEIEATGKPIGAYDLLIAGQALRNKVTLVTANTKEFQRVSGLAFEDWAKG